MALIYSAKKMNEHFENHQSNANIGLLSKLEWRAKHEIVINETKIKTTRKTTEQKNYTASDEANH